MCPQIEALDQPFYFSRIDGDGQTRGIKCGPGELVGLKTLVPEAKAVAMPVQDLQPVKAPVDEGVQRLIERTHAELLLHDGRERADGLPEVDACPAQEDGLDVVAGMHQRLRPG